LQGSFSKYNQSSKVPRELIQTLWDTVVMYGSFCKNYLSVSNLQ